MNGRLYLMTTGLYRLLLRLYPAAFRELFAEEMVLVFQQETAEARRDGKRILIATLMREMVSVIRGATQEQVQRMVWGKESAMPAEFDLEGSIDGGTGSSNVQGEDRGRWRQVIAGVIPIFLFGLAYILKGLDYALAKVPAQEGLLRLADRLLPENSMILLLVVYLVVMAGLAAGWWQGFPRWTMAYAGSGLIFAWWLGGWRAWLPWLVVLGVMLLATRTARPLRRLGQQIRRDWTWISFFLYSGASFILMGASYDSKTWYQQPLRLPLDLLQGTLVLSGGALVYMACRARWQRALALATSLCLYLLPPLIDWSSSGRVPVLLLLIWLAPVWLPAALNQILSRLVGRLRPVS